MDKLIAVDVSADVWKSTDGAPTWSLVKDDYNSTDGNNAADLVIDGNKNIFILNNQAVWKSTDAGASWSKVSSDYNGAETQNGVRITRDSNNNLYIAEADEDIWHSADSGANWTKKAANMNGSNGNAGGLVGISSTLYLADARSDIWKSTDSGANWTLVKDDYNGADGNGTSYMTADTSGNLYIVYNQAVWKSTDAGASWTKITTDYNGSETQNAVVMAINSSGHLFIVEGDEDIWRSTNDGTNWIKQATNFNGGNGNVVGLGYITVSTNITFGARSGSTNPPTDSFAGSLTNPAGGNPNVSNAQYFQYQASFSTEDSGVTPELSSVTVTYTSPDTTAPATVSNLALSSPSNSAMTVSWTAPGDDDSSGTATNYDLRYSTSAITSGNFSSATQVTGEPTPSVAGSSESLTVTGLSPSTTYYFALKTSDEVPNTSAISNVQSLATTATPDTTAPATISDLVASSPSSSAITLTWTAPGDDGSTGTATSYDLRYSTANITEGNFNSATAVTGEPTPSVAGTSQNLTVTGLSPSTTYFFAIKTSDEVPNTSAISNVPNAITSSDGGPPPPPPEPLPSPTPTPSASGGVAPTHVKFIGQAYPGSAIEVLRRYRLEDIYRVEPFESSYIITPQGEFTIILTGLLSDEYFFGLRATDPAGRKSNILSFSFNLLEKDRFSATDIFFPPTIEFERALTQGKELVLKGSAAPNGVVELFLDEASRGNAVSDASGAWTITAATAAIKTGNHTVKARQVFQDKISGFTTTQSLRISSLVFPKADFNKDEIVNITDWSVFLFEWSKKSQVIDLDGNNKTDIADFGIFLRAMRLSR